VRDRHLKFHEDRDNLRSIVSGLESNSLSASVRAVRPSARSLVVGFSVDLATSRNLLPAVVAQGAALLMKVDRIGGYRHTSARHRGG